MIIANTLKFRREYIFLMSILIFSCSENKKGVKKQQSVAKEVRHKSSEFQAIIDSANVKGSILIYDLQKEAYHSNDFEWSNTGKLPASTFKIPNSIIALETGVVENDSTLFKWNGESRGLRVWEQDLIFSQAFHYSCVPCYQDVARRIGATRMNQYLSELSYGDMKVDSTNIDLFWLEGESKISQYQQIDFLKRFYQQKLPIRKRTDEIMRRMMVLEKNASYTLSGKTGWSIRNGNNNGWFVGFIETKNGVYFFTSNVEPEGEFNQESFVVARKEVVYKALKQLKIIEE